MKNTYRILIVKNKMHNIDITPDIIDFAQYIRKNTGLEPDIDVRLSDLSDLEIIDFNVKTHKNGKLTNSYGLSNIKNLLRNRLNVPKYVYNAVFFVYVQKDIKNRKKRHVANFTHFKPLYNGTEFAQVITTKDWASKGDVYRVLTHEIFHMWHFTMKRKGVATVDSMDEYDAEYDVHSLSGNRSRNLAELSPYWKQIATNDALNIFLNLLKTQIRALRIAIALGRTKTDPNTKLPDKKSKNVKKVTLDQWAAAIKKHEGWFPGSVSYRNNNPGNLRWSPFMIGKETVGNNGSYATFKDYETGWKALIHQLKIAVNGKSGVYNPDMTLIDFFNKYAPSSDNNNPDAYAKAVSKNLGVKTSFVIKDFII